MSLRGLIHPRWPAPGNVRAVSTTRIGGVSSGPWRSLNLGLECGDTENDVLANRRRLREVLPSEPLWLRQVHGHRVVDDVRTLAALPEADAAVSSTTGQVLAVLTADCLPVLLCDMTGREAAIAHAGWRGLAGGVIENTVAAMAQPPEALMAWLGPCIGGDVYEVGDDVREAFASPGSKARCSLDVAFKPSRGRWKLSLEAAARAVLRDLGVHSIHGGGFCTLEDHERFFSFRRDGVTGRMASLIWLQDGENEHG